MKNKMNKSINWPTGTFTIEDVRNLNPSFIDITIRARITKEINNYNMEHIGDINVGRGRPRMLLARTPVIQQHIDEAKEKGAMIRHSVTVTVAEVTDSHLHDTDITLKSERKSEHMVDSSLVS